MLKAETGISAHPRYWNKKILSRHLQNTSAIGIWSELQGVYLAADAWPDELYLLSLTNSRIVFSHETALFLHVLMECEPKYTSGTVKAGYNASHLRNKGIRVYQVKPDIADLGVTEVQTGYGNKVRVYDKERAICGMLADSIL